MEFKTKDLFVTVFPKGEVDREVAKVCLLRTIICRNPTVLCPQATRVCDKCTLLPTYIPCLPCSKYITCGICSNHGTIGCGFLHSCGPGGSVCDPTIFCPGGSREPIIIDHLEDLVTLRAELQTALKGLDAMQKEGLPSAIGSKAQAEALERGLNEALDQVRAAKKNL